MTASRPSVRTAIAHAYWAVSRWKFVSQSRPPEGGAILIGAPHTSNWDFVLMLAITARVGISAKYLGKHTLFEGPFGPLMRALGGIPVDRRDPRGVVDHVVGRMRAGEQFYLVVTPEGTRAKGEYWKSGFYRIAMETGLPVTLGFVDRATRTAGIGVTFKPTGDVAADMDLVRAFYADKGGHTPARRTEPRFREEGTGEIPSV